MTFQAPEVREQNLHPIPVRLPARKTLSRMIATSLAMLVVAGQSGYLYGQTAPTAPPSSATTDAAKEAEKKATEAANEPAASTSPSTTAATASKQKAEQIEAVVVTGIRASLEKSLDVKKEASANVEVITAEDIGKMPDKNLADSLQRLSGIAVRTDYDEAEKVSIRGTNPDMTLIIFNGHTVSGGDWYVTDQLSSSRSTSLSLVPSSILDQALVYKTSQANIVDGGLAGTINVRTAKPLDRRTKFGGVASAGGVYATLPDKTSHNINATLHWKNDANDMGVIMQGFAEKRFIRRDSVSRFAYGANSGWDVINTSTMLGITDASLAGTGLRAADLNGVRIPGSMSSEFIEGVRDRQGGVLSFQAKPVRGLDVNVTGFYSTMDANNYGRLTSGAIYSMLVGKNDPFGGVAATSANTSSNGQRVYAQIRNPVIVNQVSTYGLPSRVLVAGDIVFPNGTTPQYVGNSESFYRDGANASSGFVDVDAKYKINDQFSIKTLMSSTRGVGTTALDQGLTFARYGLGISYRFNGLYEAPDSRYIGAGANVPVRNADGSGYSPVSRGAATYKTVDKEFSYQLDGEWKQGFGPLSSLDVGARFADHDRDLLRSAPHFRSAALPQIPTDGYNQYPGNFGNQLGGNNWDRTGFYLSPSVLQAYISANIKPTTPEFERRVAGEIDMRERQTAAYIMQNFDGDWWSGNFGVRFVRTQINASIVTPTTAVRCPKTEPGKPVVPCVAIPSAIVTAGDGSTYYDGVAFNPLQGAVYYKTEVDRTFDHTLPSLNLRFEIAKDLVARVGASRTIGRQNYNIIGAGFTSPTCASGGCTVIGPNPNLKPLTADNIDLSLAWYFNKRSAAVLNLYRSKIDGYVKTGSIRQDTTVELLDPLDGTVKPFFVISSSQQGAEIRGIEGSFEAPIWGNFGFTGNVSRAFTKVDDGRPMTGASSWAGNAGVYFENDSFSARLVYNYRGRYVASTTAPAPTVNSQGTALVNGVVQPAALFWAAPVSNVALSMNYDVTKAFRVSFDATNLLNPARATYRYSEQEQQKLDVSGRQYYLVLRYKF
jgi:iron complex outermembrane recepter protein